MSKKPYPKEFRDDANAGMRLEPQPEPIEEPELTLLDLASGHGQQQIQGQLLQSFGHLTCPSCSQRVRISEAPG